MTKKLNIAGIQNELSGESAFFPSYANKPAPAEEPAEPVVVPRTIVTPVPQYAPYYPYGVKRRNLLLSGS